MGKKIVTPVFMLLLMALTGCIKETFDMGRLSERVKLSPAFSMAAASGDISLFDLVEPNDTVIFDNDNFIRLVLKKDSIIDFKLEDYYDLNDMVSFNRGYKVGDVMIDDFHDTLSVSLAAISQAVSAAFYNNLLLLDDGAPHNFPSFGYTDVGEINMDPFPNFQSAQFSSGSVEISVKNNLTIPLYDLKIKLFNASGHTLVGQELTINAVNPGETSVATMNLAGLSVSNSLIAEVVILGSNGGSNVIIDMDQNIEVSLYGYDLKVKSGTIIIPKQTINSLDNKDTIDFDPGSNIEIVMLKVTSGNISYTITNNSSLSANLSLSMPTSVRGSSPVSEDFTIGANSSQSGNINVDNTEVNLSTDQNKIFNRLPIEYSLSVSSSGSMVNFSNADFVNIDLKMLNPEMDYVKGYFGQLEQLIAPETIDTGLDEILKRMTGQFYISNPSITFIYSNSFGIPIGVTLNATGIRGNQIKDLGLDPFTIEYPSSLATRDVTSAFTITKDNSSIADLVSLPPGEVNFSGSGKMNPQGFTGTRDNLIFGSSRFVASLEVEVPMELWINSLQLSDTVDNFLDIEDNDSSFDPQNMDLFLLNITTTNGFPLGASLKVMLYDSLSATVIKTIDASDLILPAPVDANGKVTAAMESTTSIEFDKDFFEASKESESIIFSFTLNTTGEGSKDVRIYADYKISFRAAVKIKPNLEF